MKKEKIRINFVDFWPNLIKDDNYFYHLLSNEYDVVIDEKSPDILFFSVDYRKEKKHKFFDNSNTRKIFFTGENTKANYEDCHASISFLKNDDNRNYRLPLWALFINWFNVPYNKKRDQAYLIGEEDLLFVDKKKLKLNKKFCSFVASNPSGKRLDFVPKLQSQKHVDCGGSLLNNTGRKIKGRGDQKWKIKYISKFRFNIAFENEIGEGYVTEKILHPMSVNSIPIYWGSDLVNQDFNSESFINARNYENDEELIDGILDLENNKELYMEKLAKPWFKDNKFPEYALPQNVLKFINEVLNS